MENPEVKSQSDDIKAVPVSSVTIDPMPQDYKAVLSVKYEDLRKAFDVYWSEHEAELVKQYNVKGKKSKGGKIVKAQRIVESQTNFEGLYTAVLSEIALDNLERVLFIQQLHLLSFDETQELAQIGVVFNHQVDFIPVDDLNYECAYPVKLTEDDAFMEEQKARGFAYLTYDSLETLKTDTDMLQALLTVKSIEGGIPESLKALVGESHWVSVTAIPESLRNAIIDGDVGSVFDTEYADGDAKCSLQVSVHEARRAVQPTVEKLAKELGHESVEDYRAKFNQGFADYVARAKELVAQEHLVSQVLAVKVPQFPPAWIRIQAQRLQRQYEQQYGDASALQRAMGVSNDAAVVHICSQEVLQQATKEWALSCVAGTVKVAEVKFADKITWTDAE